VWRITFAPSAVRELDRLEESLRTRVIAKIATLSNDPHPRGSIKLEGEDGMYRLRVGDYRILYAVLKKELEIVIAAIQHRSDVYRKR
jgi:mRNA interferase RelE/StbE